MSERVVVVTGTASGIGRATARRLAGSGWRVFGGDREAPRAEPIAGVTETQVDVREEGAVEELVARAAKDGGRLDAVVSNAAYGLGGAIEETSVDEGKGLFDVNFFGAVRLVRAALPRFRAAGSGRLIIVSSGAGFTAEPFAGYYTSSKFALEGLGETLWHELRPFAGLHVSLVEPGWARTPIVSKTVRARDQLSAYDGHREACFDAATAYCDGGINPDRVAATIAGVLAARRPRLRNRVGPDVNRSFWARWFLPERWFLPIVFRYYHLDRPRLPASHKK